jgi:imidazolonepropionase-like amidohydrolase
VIRPSHNTASQNTARLLALAIALPFASLQLAAQDLLAKAAPQKGPVLLTNGIIHTVSDGIVLGGSIWFDQGKIQAILPAGASLELPAGLGEPVRIDLEGKHVFPGMISAHTSLGLIEIGSVPQSVDTDELGEQSPEALALTAVNPDSAAIPVARRNGVLLANVFPIGGMLPGRASLIQLDGWTNADMAVRRNAGPVISWPSSGRSRFRGRGDTSTEDKDRTARQQAKIDAAFTAAKAWSDARTNDPTVALDIRHAALVPALRGEVPVFVLANAVEQIEAAIQWGIERKLRIIIVGGHEARGCAAMLKRHQVPVIIDGVHRLPRREDVGYDEAFTLPRDLKAAGVKFCIATGSDYSNDRNLPYHAATAAAYGLSEQDAFAAITMHVAEILGVGDQVGSLKKGMDATLFIATGHPFELTTKIESAFVQGRQIDLRTKQTQLAKKYRERYRQLRGK